MQDYPEAGSENKVGYNRNRKRWIAYLALALILIAGSIFLTSKATHHSSSFPPADQEQSSTTFQGMSSFISDGLTTEQVNSILGAFSRFSPKAKTVSINTGSLVPGPHDPSKLNPFTIGFNLTIDSTPYKGVASYSDLNSIRLTLYTSTGKQVYDSGVIPAQE
jgi:hypothetical protein